MCLSCNCKKNAKAIRFLATGWGMKDEDAKQFKQLLGSIVISLERLADHFAPVEAQRKKQPAILSTAIYDREERERQKLRETLRAKEQKPEGRTTPPYERGL